MSLWFLSTDTMPNHQKIIDVTITIFFGFIAFFLYNNILIDGDVAWHIEGARRLLQGGDYLINVFDNNSPLVFFFYAPPVLLRHLIPISFIYLINLYLTIWVILILLSCHALISKLIPDTEYFVKRVIYYTLVYAFLFLPNETFGQREIILTYLFMPYFFLTLVTLSESRKQPLNKAFVFLCIILGIIGIFQNFFYIFLPLFLDTYSYLKRKKLEGYQILFYGLTALAILILTLSYPNYIKYIIPQTLCYESAFNFPLALLFLEILAFVSLLTLAVVVIHFKKLYSKDDIILTAGMVILCLLIYFMEMKLWYYHLYPALTFTILLLAFILTKFYKEAARSLTISICLAMMLTIAFVDIQYFRTAILAFRNTEDPNNQWINFARQEFDNKKVFLFTMPLTSSYSLPIYTNTIVVSPWSNPWFVPYIIKKDNGIIKKDNFFCNFNNDRQIFDQVLISSLLNYTPDYLVVEHFDYSVRYRNEQFYYLTFFAQNTEVKKLLNNYGFKKMFKNFDIYQRKQF